MIWDNLLSTIGYWKFTKRLKCMSEGWWWILLVLLVIDKLLLCRLKNNVARTWCACRSARMRNDDVITEKSNNFVTVEDSTMRFGTITSLWTVAKRAKFYFKIPNDCIYWQKKSSGDTFCRTRHMTTAVSGVRKLLPWHGISFWCCSIFVVRLILGSGRLTKRPETTPPLSVTNIGPDNTHTYFSTWISCVCGGSMEEEEEYLFAKRVNI